MIKLLDLLMEDKPKKGTGKAAPYGSGYAPVKELVTDTEVICDKCDWKWAITNGGIKPFLCKCGHDNTPEQIKENGKKASTNMKNKQGALSLRSILNELGFSLNEAETGEAVLFESALVYAWYKLKGLPVPDDAISPDELKKLKSNKILVTKAENTIKSLGLTGGKSAKSIGRSGGSITTTPFWNSFGATNTTPKTDIMLGNKRISVKVGNAQLMSGGKNESLATFYAAAKHVPGILETQKAKDVIDTFEKFVTVGYTKDGSVETNIKGGKDKIIQAADKAHKEMSNKLEALFNESEAFKIAFAQEAMSGYEKFGPNSEAYAQYVLSVDKNYDNPQLHSTQDDSYASKIAAQMKLTVRFKSTSEKLKGEKTGRYRFWSVVSLISNSSKLKESLADSLKNIIDKITDYITQGVASLTKFVIGDNPENIDIEVDDSVDFNV